jgi:predicted ATPase
MMSVSKPDSAFVEEVRIQNFGCVRDARLELTRLHALIGPNDSGKSTVLAAMRTAGELLDVGEHTLALAGRLDPRGVPGTRITMQWGSTRITCDRDQGGWGILGAAVDLPEYRASSPLHADHAAPARGATVIRWDPDAIRQPCELIAEGNALTMSEKGAGLPAVYEAILSQDRHSFDEIEEGLREHFPTIRGIWLPTFEHSRKAIGVTLVNGTKVQANQLSEGLLYWLAFAVLPYIDPTALLLIEEPENGLHPSRIADVMKALRAVSNRMQIILATHSPLVINELRPEEVTILTRDARLGTRARRLDRTKHFQQRQQVYALGELWLSFADGVDEAALVPEDETSSSTG